jgi:hypothetical protein
MIAQNARTRNADLREARSFLPAVGRCNGRFGSGLTAFGTVEEHPHHEVLGEFLKTMGLARSNKQERAGLDLLPTGSVEEHAASPGNEIGLVSVMQLLGIVPDRCVQLHFKRSAREDRHRQVTGRRGAPQQSLCKADVSGPDVTTFH